ncbi:MAG: hypothetical protein P8L78_20155 [Mariniblastus sp.]|jgi:hypothetical protein|nr:hypothetical protein [bacterium]MDG1511030.1 hypothetical protein [Mariniblastus sp.]MDG2184016.1 hypothetical protein [Mariniblastus sp.]
MDQPTLALLYQYGIGGTLFFASLFLAFQSGAIRWDNLKNRILVVSMTAGLLLFAATHAAWTFYLAR